MKTSIPVFSISLALSLFFTGCAFRSPLRLGGHTKENLHSPPNIQLKVGESKLAVKLPPLGEAFAPAWGTITIADETIVRKTTAASGALWLYGLKAGRTKASYSGTGLSLGSVRDGQNHGFWIIVQDSRESQEPLLESEQVAVSNP